jgi:Zn-dependent protease with chaperone function
MIGALGLVIAPIGNTFSRRLESHADDFALALTGDPAAFVAANGAARRPEPGTESVEFTSRYPNC